MRYLDTFAGVGGFSVGIHNAYRSTIGRSEAHQEESDAVGEGLLTSKGEDSSTQKGQVGERSNDIAHEGPLRIHQSSAQELSRGDSRDGSGAISPRVPAEPLCIGYSEIDRYASSIYEKHYPGVKNYGDITKINAEQLPDFDCLVGGFPCQSFSIAGKRGGFEDTRGTLFFDLARILRRKRPPLFVFENVKGLLSHDRGRTFATIITTLDELGYDCQWQVINSKNHGVPQNRERIIIVGNLRGTPRPQVFPLTDTSFAATPQQFASTTIDANYWKGIDNHGQRTAIVRINKPVHSTNRVYSPEGISPALSTMQGGGRQPYISLSGNGTDSDSQADTAGVREASGVPRRMDVMSDTQRYKMMGNAVTTNVIQAVFERIFATI